MINSTKFLEENFEANYRDFSSKLCYTSYPIMGVRLPKLKAYVKGLSLDEKFSFLDNFNPIYFEHTLLYGFILGSLKCDIDTFLIYFNKFLPYVDNWSTCDSSVATFKIIGKNLDNFKPIIENLLRKNVEFFQRVALVILLDYYILDEYLDYIFHLVDGVKSSHYYVNMAIAWLLSVCYIKYPNQTEKYLRKTTLDDFTFNKTLSKICDSFRVLDEDKVKIRDLRRKK